MAIATHACDLSAAKYLDVRCVHDAMREIARHAFAKIVAANQQKHPARVLRKIDSGLARAIAAPDQDDIGTATHLDFVRRGRRRNPGTFKSAAMLNVETAIF